MKHIPNILSGFRIVLIPFFVWQALADNFSVAAVILAISGLTDLLDGRLARKYDWVTQLGKILDPIADKLTLLSVCVVFIIKWPQYWAFFAIYIVKDLIMLCMGGYLLKQDVKIEGAKWFGKIATVVFYVTMVVLPFVSAYVWVTFALLALVTVCVITAGLLYIPDFMRYREEKDSQQKIDSTEKEKFAN